MAPCEITDDYYAILELPQDATLEAVKKSYRRLAIALHPDRNLNNPCATASFQSLLSAYETISDPGQRRIYDIQWPRIRNRKTTEEETAKRQAKATETEQTRAAEEKAKKQKEQAVSLEQLRQLEGQRSNYDNKIFELNRVIRNLAAALKRFQEKDDEELRKERERDGWWAYITSPIYGKQVPETEEQKQQREVERLQRLHTKSIKEKDLIQQEASLYNLKDRLHDVNSKIAAVKQKCEDARRAEEAKRHERLRKEQEAKKRAEVQEERERQAKREAEWARWWKETATRAAKQAEEAQKVKEAQERARVAREAREAEERIASQQREQRARASREAAQAARKNKSKSATTPAYASKKGSTYVSRYRSHSLTHRFRFYLPADALSSQQVHVPQEWPDLQPPCFGLNDAAKVSEDIEHHVDDEGRLRVTGQGKAVKDRLPFLQEMTEEDYYAHHVGKHAERDRAELSIANLTAQGQ